MFIAHGSYICLSKPVTMNRNTAVSLGITYGIVSIIIFLLQALLDSSMVVSVLLGTAALVAVIALPIMFIRKERMAAGGYISFWAVFRLTSLGLVVGGVISTTFSLVYISYIDPGYPEQVLMSALETQKKFMEGAMGREQMEEIMRETEESIRDGFTTTGMLKTFGYYVIFYLVLGLIFAAFMKKEPPRGADETPLDSETETFASN